MAIINMQEAKTHLSRLVERAQAGERIVIARSGRPVVELTPVVRADIVFGGLRGEIDIDYEAFDAADSEIADMWASDLGVER